MYDQLYQGDSIEIMKRIQENKVNMIYLDPPFFTNRSFESSSYDGNKINFEDIWKNGINEYLEFMRNVIQESIRILSKTGLLFLHCDWHANHYLKIELDKIFGYHNFVNEIIWKRHNSQNNSKQGSKIFGRLHDTIFIYSKDSTYTWNHLYQQYSKEYVDKTYNKIDKKTKERYALGDLSGPGGSSKGNPYFEFLGFKKYWRYNKQKMTKLYEENKIVQTKPNTVPKLKRYLKDMKGIGLSDIWTDIQNEQTKNKKNIMYPTQKPVTLLERIISCSTKKGDLVLDPFCGSGTTLIACNNLERRWIGIDSNAISIKTIQNRLELENVKKNQYEFKKIMVKHIQI